VAHGVSCVIDVAKGARAFSRAEQLALAFA